MDFRIGRNQHFVLEQCRSCALPGYLILSAVEPANSLTDLSVEAQRQLGPSVAAATALIRCTLQPAKVYCAQFGETDDWLHFHLFPRTRALTRAYCEAFPGQTQLIHGPLLLDWARERYSADEAGAWSKAKPMIERMRNALSATAGDLCFAPAGARV